MIVIVLVLFSLLIVQFFYFGEGKGEETYFQRACRDINANRFIPLRSLEDQIFSFY